MRYLTLFPLSGYRFKYLGAAICLVALVAGAVHVLGGTQPLADLVAPDLQPTSIIWLLAMGLFLMTFSKEKVDDERVQQIRYTAFRGAAMMGFLMVLCAFCPLFWERTPNKVLMLEEDAVPALLMLGVVPLLLYQIVFHIGLQLDPHWAYNDLDTGDNIRRNPRFFFYYALCIALGMGILILVKVLLK